MIHETLARLEAALKTVHVDDARKKAILLDIIAALKSEIERLTATHEEQARSIAGFAAIAAHEATRKDKSEKLLKLSLQGLETSAQGFELSHPKLVDAVNDICVFLARLGI